MHSLPSITSITTHGAIQFIRRWQLYLRGLHLERSCQVGTAVSVGTRKWVISPASIQIGPECQIEQGVELNPWDGKICIGRNVFLGPYVVIYGQGGVVIGDNTLLAMHCCILSSNHTVSAPGQNIRSAPDILLPTKIGKDCWLGAGVKVLGGVTIGDGCVVGAGAVVTRDLPEYSIAIGIPAKVASSRNCI